METKNHLDCVLHFYCTLILNMYIYCDEEVMLCAYNQVEVFFSFWNVKFWIPSSVEFEYGHPDVFDRIFHITRGGVSKASKQINLSEDIFAGTRPQLYFYI